VAHLTLAELAKKKKKSKERSINQSPDPLEEDMPSVAPALVKMLPLEINSKPVLTGTDISLTIRAPETSFAYCFYQESPDRWMRIFPNRYASDPLLMKGKPLSLPGEQKIQIKAGPKETKEMLACFNTSADIGMALSPEVRGGDFEPNPNLTLTRLRQEFATVTSNTYAEALHEIRKR
jgi:hypothetical protein